MTLPPNTAALKHARFIASLALDGNVTRACRESGADRPTVYDRRKNDPVFAQQWADALEVVADRIEAEALRRAVTGVKEPVIYQGVPMYLHRLDEHGRSLLDENGKPIYDLDEDGRPKVLSVMKYSDSLLSQMLKAKRKEYRDSSKLELTGAEGGPLQIEETPTQIARRIAFALALGLRAAKESASQPDDGSDLA